MRLCPGYISYLLDPQYNCAKQIQLVRSAACFFCLFGLFGVFFLNSNSRVALNAIKKHNVPLREKSTQFYYGWLKPPRMAPQAPYRLISFYIFECVFDNCTALRKLSVKLSRTSLIRSWHSSNLCSAEGGQERDNVPIAFIRQ